jgi:hypothetical protein
VVTSIYHSGASVRSRLSRGVQPEIGLIELAKSRFNKLPGWPVRARPGTILRGTGGITLSIAGALVTVPEEVVMRTV